MNMEGNRRFLSPREIEAREGIGVARRAQRPGREGHGLQFFFRTADSTGARRFFWSAKVFVKHLAFTRGPSGGVL